MGVFRFFPTRYRSPERSTCARARALACGLSASFWLMAQDAAAQSGANDSANDAAIEQIVVTAARQSQTLGDVPQSISLIDAKEIQSRQNLAVTDFLRRVPGVGISQNGGLGTTSSVRIRGAEGDQTLLLIDGVKFNDPASPGGGFDFGNLLIANVMQIEVLRGAQSVLWGSQAIGGVVNIRTQAPETGIAAHSQIEGGWRGTGKAQGDVSFGNQRVDARLGFGFLRTNNISAFAENRGGQEQDGYRNFSANARIDIHLPREAELELRQWISAGRTQIDGFPPPDFTLADTPEFSTVLDQISQIGLSAPLFGNHLRNHLSLAYTRTSRENFDPQSGLEPGFGSRGGTYRLEYQGIWQIAPGIESVFGAETEFARFRISGAGLPDQQARSRLSSLYNQWRIEPLTRLHLEAGIRYDQHSQARGNVVFAAAGAYRLADGKTSLRASFGEGFKAPSLFQLFSDFGNEVLAPERARSWDAGVNHRFFGQALNWELEYYRRETRNQIDFISCFADPRSICVDRPFGVYDNLARTSAQGIATSFQGSIGRNWTLGGNYTLLLAQNRADQTRLARRARHSANGQIDYHYSGDKGARSKGFGDWSAGLGWSYVGQSFDDNANQNALPAYLLMDLHAELSLRDHVSLYGRIENLLDAQYETALNFGTRGRAAFIGLRANFR